MSFWLIFQTGQELLLLQLLLLVALPLCLVQNV